MPRGCRVGYVQQDLDEAVLDTPLLEWVVDVLPDWHDFWSAWEAAAASKDEAAIARLGARQAELEALYGYNPEHKAQAVLSGLGFDEGKWHLPIKQLSGGGRGRAQLARVLVAGAAVLLLDEPTNHLDLESREALVEALNAFDGTLLMVAHDRYLLSEVADEAWSMAGDGITVYKEGFAEYDVARRAALAASKAGKEREKDAGRKAEGPVPGKALDREELKRLKREQAEQRNALYKKMRPKQEAYAKLETQLEALLTEQSDVEAALADPEVYADGNKTTELLKKFSQLKESSEQALEKLGELEAELAELEAQRAALSMNGGGDEL